MSLFSFFFKKNKPEVKKPRVLFLVRKRVLPHYTNPGKTVSTGLLNSANFVVNMLAQQGDCEVLLKETIDNNCIDKEVTAFKPDIVIIEALWVVPEKFEILNKLHPNVIWVMRLHSDTPFLALEGTAIQWIRAYLERYNNIFIAPNSERLYAELSEAFCLYKDKIGFMPNYYEIPKNLPKVEKSKDKNEIHIGCFGAVRPLKNHLIQAMSAIRYANRKGLNLKFHINANRCEDNGDPVLKNLRCLFENLHAHELVEHSWVDHDEFLKVIGQLDLSMQVSFSETFNIVSCDAVAMNVPILVSKEVYWANKLFKVETTDGSEIVDAIDRVLTFDRIKLTKLNQLGLNSQNSDVKRVWKEQIKVLYDFQQKWKIK